MKKTIFVFVIGFIMIMPIFATYYTLESPDFYVHFPAGYEDLAGKLITQAEPIMDVLREQFNPQIHEKIHFVIEDRIDLPNGYTTNAMYPLISLFPVFPDDILLGGIGPYVNDWFDMLLWHEGTHLVHLEMQDPFAYVLSGIFGRFPLFYPLWGSPIANLEGLAVFNETKHQTIGRGSGLIYEMILDAAIDADNIPNPRLILGLYDHNKFDLAGYPYIYGWNFMEFLKDTYGPEAPFDLQKNFVHHRGKLFVSKFDAALLATTGKTYLELHKTWFKWLKDKYDKPPLNPEGKIYKTTEKTISPGFFSENYFYFSGIGNTPGIYRIDLTSGEEELVAFIPNIHGKVSRDKEGRIYYTKLDNDLHGNTFFNIYYYHNGKTFPFISDQRAYAPFAVGNNVYYLKRLPGKSNSLYRKQWDGASELIYTPNPGEEILQFTVSSNGEVFASIWCEGGFANLATIKNREAHFLTKDRMQDTFPVLNPDESMLFFQSNRGSRYGIWALDLETREIAPVVTDHYGAFKPVLDAINPGRLGFISYADDGLKIGVHTLEKELCFQKPLEEDIRQRIISPKLENLLEKDKYTLTKYRGLAWLKPTFWTPNYVGANLLGGDPLQNYLYTVEYSFNPLYKPHSPKNKLSVSMEYLFNPLHSLTFEMDTSFKDFDISAGYLGIIPIGDKNLRLETAYNSRGLLLEAISLEFPWGKKTATGNNYIFQKGLLGYSAKSEPSFENLFGAGHNLKAGNNLKFNIEVVYRYNKKGYLSSANSNLGRNLFTIDTGVEWIFARPMWSIGASPTMWSEKMSLTPKITLLSGKYDFDIGLGLQYKNTAKLMYGSFDINFGVEAMFFPKNKKLFVSPIFSL